MSRKKILFVCYGGGHVAMVIPVLQALQELGTWEITILGLTTATAKLKAAGIPSLGFRDLVTDQDQIALQHGERLAGPPVDGPVSRDESVAYLGLSFAELAEDLGVDEAQRRYDTFGRIVFHPVRRIGMLIDKVQPDVVVTTNSPRAERAALKAARDRGIPAVSIVDLTGKRQLDWLAHQKLADRVCVLSESVRKDFLASGRADHEVVATGNPAFDTIGDPTLLAKAARLKQDRGWSDSALNILWASQIEPPVNPFDGEKADVTLPAQIEQALLSIVDRHPGWRLIVRPHPSENRTHLPAPHGSEWSTQHDPLHVVLHAVDAVVVMMSTVGLEASLVGKPVISVDRSVLTKELPLAQLGISRGVTDWDQLETALRDIAAGQHPVHPTLPVVGSATRNVVKVIRTLVGDS